MFYSKFLFFLLFVLIFPLLVQGAGLVPCGGPGEPTCTFCHLFLLVKNITDTLSTKIAPPILIIMAIISGVVFMTAGGSEERIRWAREIILSAVIGFVIVLGAWLLVNTVVVLATGNPFGEIFGQPWHTIEC